MFGLSNDVCSTRLVHQQSTLAEVIAWLVLLHHSGGLARLEILRRSCLAFDDHVELIASLTFADDVVATFEPLFFQGIGYAVALVTIHAGEDFNFSEECVVLLTLLLHRGFDDVSESFAVEGPEIALRLSRDGGGSRCVVQQCQLTKRFARLVSLEEGLYRCVIEDLCARQLALLN